MDKIQDFTVLTADSNLQLIAQTIPLDSHAPTIPTAGPSLGEDHPDRYMLDEVDVIIRIAFVQFLFDPEILGIIEQHLCIYRLFPRPVVALRNSAFLTSYRNTVSTSDTCFIKELIKTQVSGCVSGWSHFSCSIMLCCSVWNTFSNILSILPTLHLRRSKEVNYNHCLFCCCCYCCFYYSVLVV